MGTFALAAVGLAGSGVGAALGLPLLWPAAGRRDETRLLGAWLVAVSIMVVVISSRLLGFIPDGAAAEHAINLAGLAAYPFLFLYLQRITGRARPDGPSALVWLPAAAYAVAVVARASVDDSTRVPFAWMLPVVFAYTAACILLVARRRPATERMPDALVPAVPLVVGVVVLNVAQVIRMSFGYAPPVRAVVPLVLTGEFVGLVALVAWRARGLATAGVPVSPAAPRYERSGLDDDAARALAVRIETALVERRLFADPGLTLARLAGACRSTPHQVSEALNRMAGETFHELIARHRVADVKRQLEDPASDVYSIEGIGLSAGFGSRSTLYAAFRGAVGMTPAEYRARHRA
jgi:AraC-like DNA-binding protein